MKLIYNCFIYFYMYLSKYIGSSENVNTIKCMCVQYVRNSELTIVSGTTTLNGEVVKVEMQLHNL